MKYPTLNLQEQLKKITTKMRRQEISMKIRDMVHANVGHKVTPLEPFINKVSFSVKHKKLPQTP